jgi:hypothetical protein
LISPTSAGDGGGDAAACIRMEAVRDCRRHAAAQCAQSELFFRLLLKNTVCALQIAAYAYFWRVPFLAGRAPTKHESNYCAIYLFIEYLTKICNTCS